jgi:hypothetical protein
MSLQKSSNIKHLLTFQKVARSGSVSIAAAELFFESIGDIDSANQLRGHRRHQADQPNGAGRKVDRRRSKIIDFE